MADPIVWGLLPKAQDDAQTIDEAITAALAAHLADPDAHMDSGASLDLHRTNGVLDHPVGASLADKATMSELAFNTQFENSALFSLHGSPTFAFPGFGLTASANGYSNRQEVSINGEDLGFVLNFANDFLFQFACYIDTYNHGTFIAEISDDALSSTEKGVGLEVIEGVAKFYVAKFDGSSKSYLSWPSFTDALQYVIRMQYVQSEGKVYFYINGELLGTLTYPDTSASDVLYMKWEHYRSASSAGNSQVYNVFYSLAPNQ